MKPASVPRRALVVHPDRATCRHIKAALEQRGYQVEPCLGPDLVPCPGLVGMPCSKVAWAAAGSTATLFVPSTSSNPGTFDALAFCRSGFTSVVEIEDGADVIALAGDEEDEQ